MPVPVATPMAARTMAARTMAARTMLVLLLTAVVAASTQDKQDARGSSGSSEATALLAPSPSGADPYKSSKLQVPAAALPPQASGNDERQRFLNVVLPTAAKTTAKTTARAPARASEQLRVNKQQQERDREELDYRYYWGNTGARVEGYDPGYGGGGGGYGGNYPQVDLGECTPTRIR